MALNTNRSDCLHKIISDYDGNHNGTIQSLFTYYYDKKVAAFHKKCSLIRVIIGLYIDFFEFYDDSKIILIDNEKKISFANIFLTQPTKTTIKNRLMGEEKIPRSITGKRSTTATVNRFQQATKIKPSDDFMLRLWLELEYKFSNKPKSYFDEFDDDNFSPKILEKIKNKLLDDNYITMENQNSVERPLTAPPDSMSISEVIDPSKLKSSAKKKSDRSTHKVTMPGKSGKL